jgi:L-aspartate oxidase
MKSDFLVIGAGVAGLRAAIELAGAGEVLVLAKDRLQESSSAYAQGGIAAALSDDDDIELHEHDTLAAGDGLCTQRAVHALVEDGPRAIQELIDWGAEFDREGSKLSFAREGAHSRSRVLHAHGDSTGQEIARTLYAKAASLQNVRFQSFAAVTDLLIAGGAVGGAMAYDERSGEMVRLDARAVLIATGGLGRIFLETTNPDVATGDGVAAAYRAGADVSDIEFVQFHPTALHIENAPRFLLSEALRGEGALLRNASGDRFMDRYHLMAELAPRDVVSRSIIAEMRDTGSAHVFLDLTHLDPGHIRSRFPRIYDTCLRYGVDITRNPVPVHPAAHYAMGGVRTDLDGQTSLERLYAAGEAACTGVHGANRLASNSLLEGVVFGARAGARMRRWSGATFVAKAAALEPEFPSMKEDAVRRLAWDHCGIVRNGRTLSDGLDRLESAGTSRNAIPTRSDYELRNMHTVAGLIARCALARAESRGGHYRSDFPERREEFRRHSIIRSGGSVTFESF